MFVMRTALLTARRVLPDQRPGQLAAHDGDLRHGGPDVRGATRGDLLFEVGHVRAVGGKADLDRKLALLVQEVQVALDVGGGNGRSAHGGHPVRSGFPFGMSLHTGIRDMYGFGRPAASKVSAACVIQRTRPVRV
jgi:hypothetical protein